MNLLNNKIDEIVSNIKDPGAAKLIKSCLIEGALLGLDLSVKGHAAATVEDYNSIQLDGSPDFVNQLVLCGVSIKDAKVIDQERISDKIKDLFGKVVDSSNN